MNGICFQDAIGIIKFSISSEFLPLLMDEDLLHKIFVSLRGIKQELYAKSFQVNDTRGNLPPHVENACNNAPVKVNPRLPPPLPTPERRGHQRNKNRSSTLKTVPVSGVLDENCFYGIWSCKESGTSSEGSQNGGEKRECFLIYFIPSSCLPALS